MGRQDGTERVPSRLGWEKEVPIDKKGIKRKNFKVTITRPLPLLFFSCPASASKSIKPKPLIQLFSFLFLLTGCGRRRPKLVVACYRPFSSFFLLALRYVFFIHTDRFRVSDIFYALTARRSYPAPCCVGLVTKGLDASLLRIYSSARGYAGF
jgi:hypothetical protein